MTVMLKYIDDMLRLTADVAEELLSLKDTGNHVSPGLAAKIERLAELARENAVEPAVGSSVDVDAEGEREVAADVNPVPSDGDSVSDAISCEAGDSLVADESIPDLPEDCSTEVRGEERPVARSVNADMLRKAFSLNDMFLFRRVLFGNSIGEFNRALEAISLLQSEDELKAFLKESCGIDLKTEEAKDFINIVAPFLS